MKPAQQPQLRNWIDLKDSNGAKLMGGLFQNEWMVLVIKGVRPRSSAFYRIVNDLGFIIAKNGVDLTKAVALTDRVLAAHFHSVFPDAVVRPMAMDEFFIDFNKLALEKRRKEELRNQPTSQAEEPTSDLESIVEVLNRATYMGYNLAGQQVYKGAAGRFILDKSEAEDRLVHEERIAPSPLFLRGATASEVRECAKGVLRACEKGEAQSLDVLLRFASAVLQKEVVTLEQSDRALIAQAIDSAILEALVENNDTAGKAWADAAYYQEMMPGRAALIEDSLSTPYLPAPVAVQVQRFLTSASSVLVSGKIPGFGFGLLPESTAVFVEDRDTRDWGAESHHRPSVIAPAAALDAPVDASYWRVSGSPTDAEIAAHFANISEGGVSVVTSGSLDILPRLEAHATPAQAIVIPGWLAGTAKPIHMFVLQHVGRPSEASSPKAVSISSWNDLKTLVDEGLLRIGKEAEAREAIAQESSRAENRFQRPYLAFSKTGQGSTMVPKNLQSAAAFALARLEEANGGIDDFVAAELGIGAETLKDRFSPEQVDAIGLIINRLQGGRGFILGDETGIGKGRAIASVCSWANKLGKKVIFVTDRSNLFSDLGRDLIDIGEWERFRPLITNVDGRILNIMGDAEELATPPTAAQMARIIAGDVEDNSNIIFTTYSQIHGEGSQKAAWLAQQCSDALVICDEAHIAAGSDSNIAKQIQSMVDNAWGVLYSSATWAASSKNLHIYSRALPESVNISQVASAMRADGEVFSEVFSSMLAMDGAFIRREHDLSKIDFTVAIDNVYTERNQQVAAQVSELLGMMAMVSGEINHMLQRMNAETRNALLAARGARDTITESDAVNSARAAANEARRADLLQRTSALEQAIAGLQAANPGPFAGEVGYAQIDQAVAAGGRVEVDGVLAQYQGMRVDMTSWRRQLDEIPEVTALAEHSQAPINSKAGKLFTSSFGTGGAIYQVMRRTLAALAADYTADSAIASMRAGRRPVIVFEETGEAFVRQLVNEEIERIKVDIEALRARGDANALSDADVVTREIADMLDAGMAPAEVVQQIRVPTLQDMMRGLLTKLGGIRVTDAADEARDGGDEESQSTVSVQTRILDMAGLDQDVVDSYKKGIETIAARIDALPMLPIIPVDTMRIKMERAGMSVGEISGRHYSLEPTSEEQWDGTKAVFARLKKRARKKSDVTKLVKDFNSAAVDALLLNKSAATGMSIHSSPRFPDSRQRELFEMQSDENPNNRIQLFGRVNRFDQVIPPRIAMMTTGLPGEMRPLMMQNKKLTGLSANIRSSRDNAAVMEDVPDLLNRTGDRVCQEYLLENPGIAGRLDIQMNRLHAAHGLAQMITQRLALLAPKDQDKVYADLVVAYEDALLENQLSQDSDTIPTKSWNARTIRETVAWGPRENISALSAFDSPVFRREVEFTQQYRPMQWAEVEARIVESSQRLAADPRVKPQHILCVSELQFGDRVPEITLAAENAATAQERQDMWVESILSSMSMSLPEAALQQTQDTDEADDLAADPFGDGPAPLRGVERAAQGFAALQNHWVAVEARIPGTQTMQRLMALVSRSGASAKLWFLNERGQAKQYFFNLEKGVRLYREGPGSALVELPMVEGITEDSWQRTRFNKVWGSLNPEVELVDFSSVTKHAANVMEAKKVIALPQTGYETLEKALEAGEHNAVKEAHFRQAFINEILPQLTPGTQVWIHTRESNQRFGHFFTDRRMVVSDVKIPPQGQEAVLSRWKFHFSSPGDEAETVLSGALLFKLAGSAPTFPLISANSNLYMGNGSEIAHAARQFGRYPVGPITRRKTLLVGNMFQAGEWARATKKGTSIIYTDEAGQGHRAVEIDGFNGYAASSFPLRLFTRASIKDFMNLLFDSEEAARAGVTFTGDRVAVVYTSFKGALASLSRDTNLPDQMLIDVANGAIGWKIDKAEKEKIQRTLRNAVNADQREWEADNPGSPYPVVYSTRAARSATEETQLSIKLPPTPEGRERFMDILIKTQGLQMHIPERGISYALARIAEERHYARLAAPALEDQRRAQEQRDRRERMKEMVATSFGEAEGAADSRGIEQQQSGVVVEQDSERVASDEVIHEASLNERTLPPAATPAA